MPTTHRTASPRKRARISLTIASYQLARRNEAANSAVLGLYPEICAEYLTSERTWKQIATHIRKAYVTRMSWNARMEFWADMMRLKVRREMGLWSADDKAQLRQIEHRACRHYIKHVQPRHGSPLMAEGLEAFRRSIRRAAKSPLDTFIVWAA